VQLAKWSEETGNQAVPKGSYAIFAGGDSATEAIVARFEIQ
jgi:hypothetical protein